jgi:hypothetical protein
LGAATAASVAIAGAVAGAGAGAAGRKRSRAAWEDFFGEEEEEEGSGDDGGLDPVHGYRDACFAVVERDPLNWGPVAGRCYILAGAEMGLGVIYWKQYSEAGAP